MKRTLSIIFLILLFSCQENPMDKSIIEPLTIEELRVEMDNDSLFEDNYKRIEEVREKVLTDDIKKAKYSDVTYRQVNEFLNWWRDTTNLNQFWRESDMAWEKKYAPLLKRVDSVIEYWEEYRDRNGIEESNVIATPIALESYLRGGGTFNKGLEKQIIARELLNEELEFKDEMFGYRHDSVAIADFGKVGELFLINR